MNIIFISYQYLFCSFFLQVFLSLLSLYGIICLLPCTFYKFYCKKMHCFRLQMPKFESLFAFLHLISSNFKTSIYCEQFMLSAFFVFSSTSFRIYQRFKLMPHFEHLSNKFVQQVMQEIWQYQALQVMPCLKFCLNGFYALSRKMWALTQLRKSLLKCQLQGIILHIQEESSAKNSAWHPTGF